METHTYPEIHALLYIPFLLPTPYLLYPSNLVFHNFFSALTMLVYMLLFWIRLT